MDNNGFILDGQNQDNSVIPQIPTTPDPLTPPANDPIQDSSGVTESPDPQKVSGSFLAMIVFWVVGLLLIGLLVCVIPFGDNGTILQMLTHNDGALKTGNTVVSDGYTYVTNLDLEYEPRGAFSDGMLSAYDENGETVFLDNTGSLILAVNSDYTVPYNSKFNSGLLAVRCNGASTDSSYNNTSFGYIDKTGALVIPCQFASASNFSNGYAVVSMSTIEGGTMSPSAFYPNGVDTHIENVQLDSFQLDTRKYGIIDTAGNFVVDYQDNKISELSTFENGIYEIIDANYEQYCINLQGDNLGKLDYDTRSSCYEQTSEDTTGKTIREAVQDKFGDEYVVSSFNNGVAMVYSEEKGEIYLVDTDGDIVMDVAATKIISLPYDTYGEGLFKMVVWEGNDSYPGINYFLSLENNGSVNHDSIFRNAAMVFLDREGQTVFKYRYTDHSNSHNQYEQDTGIFQMSLR